MRRVIGWVAGVALVQGTLLLLLDWLLPGLAVNSLQGAFVAGVLVTAALTLAWGGIYWLAARLHPALFPLICLILTGLLIVLTLGVLDRLYPGAITIDGLWTGIAITLGLTLGNTVVGALFSLQDDTAYERFVVRPLRRMYRATPTCDEPGVLFLEIDGLAEPILREALAQGYVPTLQRWVAAGSHRLAVW
jgi:putative membrane protein